MSALAYTLTRDDDEIDIDVEYSVSRFYPATGPCWHCPGTPAEGGEVEELEAFVDGDPIDLTDEEREQIEARIHETHDHYGDE